MSKQDSICNKLPADLSNKLWKSGRTQANKAVTIIDTGYDALNKLLHKGGWPVNQLMEVAVTQPGIGELRLLMPALSELLRPANPQNHRNAIFSAGRQHILWVAPPFLPFAPALQKEGLALEKLTLVQTTNLQDTLWATEQALLSASCAAVITWTGQQQIRTQALRRLKLAAEKSGTWCVLFRHSCCLQQNSVANLRVSLSNNRYSQLKVQLIKQPFGWGGQHCILSLPPHYEYWQRLGAKLLPCSATLHQSRPKPRAVTSHSTNVTLLSNVASLAAIQ